MNQRDKNQQDETLNCAKAALMRGEAVIFPTDTVYGLGVSVKAVKSPEVLYRLKERDRGKPVAWLVGGIGDLALYGADVPEFAYILARAYWPGPLTLVVNAAENVPAAFCSAQKTIGLRMPNNDFALRLLAAVRCPLATTSANISGCVSTNSYEAIDQTLLERVGIAVKDTTDLNKSGVASTVVDCTGKRPRVLRQGSVAITNV